MPDVTITVDRVKIRRSFVAGYRPGQNGSRPLDEGEEFVNYADQIRLIGDGTTPPALLPAIPFKPGIDDVAGLGSRLIDVEDDIAERLPVPAYLRREKWRGPHIFDWVRTSAHDAIEDGTSTVDITSDWKDAAAALQNNSFEGAGKGRDLRILAGVYNLSDKIEFKGVGIRLVGDGVAGSVINVRGNLAPNDALLELRQIYPNYSAIGIGATGLRIDMMGRQGHGLRLWKPYDGVEVSQIKVDNVADANHGLMIVPDPTVTPGDPYSQTVKVSNVNCYHANLTATASLFYIEALNEAIFELCKGFGTYYQNTNGGTNLPGLNPFELVDCNGVNLLNCSGALANEHAFLVRATNTQRLSRCVVIDTPTLELVRGAVKFVGVAGANEAFKVLEPELRSPRIVQPYVTHPQGDIILDHVRGAVIDAKSLTVAMSDTDRCRVRSDGPRTSVNGRGPGDRVEYLPSQFPRTNVRAVLGSVQSGLSSVDYDTVRFQAAVDVGTEFNNSTFTFTAKGDGVRGFNVLVSVTPNAAGIVAIRYILNGQVKLVPVSKPYEPAGLLTALNFNFEENLLNNDAVLFQVYAPNGSITNDVTRTVLTVTARNNGYAL